ncbi:MAG: MBL fold metallo-hydrolase [Chitinophagales bacterium]|nr:MBL fold metallo-hydrolase [Chitinophagales bacterium]
MKLHTIDTGYFKLDGGAMFGVVPKTMWQKLNPPDEKNLCTWAMRCMLIEDGKQLILIDCGLGNKQDEKFFGHYEPHGDASLEKSIKQLGYSFDDITDVLLSHLHFDHCGGAIKREGDKLVPAFKNATYWSNEKHWEWATKPNGREKASFLKENILPIQQSGQLKFAEDGSTALNPNIVLKTVSGHTESMFTPLIKTGDKTIVYCADLFPSMAHIPLPYIMAYDTRPLLTLDEKQTFLSEAIANNYYLFFEHDRTVELCSLKQTERGVREDKVMRLEELGN